MVGLLVTPTTEYSSTSDCRFPLRIRSRDRSSSQTATPAADNSASCLFCAMTGAFLAGPSEVERSKSEAGSAVAGGVGEAPGGRHRASRDGGAGPCRLHALARGGHDR